MARTALLFAFDTERGVGRRVGGGGGGGGAEFTGAHAILAQK